ncbi:MAG: M18 family aminopeptidase [Coriobacteriales bacterium]|nr:M18 family aminopeptidase [Coriobacteriales bacterium]MDO5708603.1 M18 family aminopeptidase [Coriobacteriales bacterium]
MDKEFLQTSRELVDFIAASPSPFHVVRSVRALLDAAGFTYLSEREPWNVACGGSYYTVRNGSSLVAFKVGATLDAYHFQMGSAHTDSPTFKVKAAPTLDGPQDYVRLNVEGYGGMDDHIWFDRQLSLAGRVMVQDGKDIQSRLLSFDRDLLLIPSVAPHLTRDIEKGLTLNRQVDLCPLFSAGELTSDDFLKLIADELGVEPSQVISFDLSLVNRQPGTVWGAAQEFVSSPKLDDLQCDFALLRGFLSSTNDHDVSVCALFDSEEVGSGTKQGALSTFLNDTLLRVNASLGKTEEEYLCALAQSFMVSCDNAHAVHPNHPELSDAQNYPRLNGGIVIKENAAGRYTTDAFSRAVFKAICHDADVPTQVFANRSDKRGGSTLGNLSSRKVSVHTVDVGLPQLAMHSPYETAGTKDTAWGIKALRAFYDANLTIDGVEGVTIG